jgi:hypothetical protein
MITKTLLLGAAAIGFAAPAFAQEPEAEAPVQNSALEEVLANVPKLLNKHWQANWDIEASMGEEAGPKVKINVKYMDKNHFSLDLNVVIPDEFEEQSMSFSAIADGTYLFLNSPNMAEVSGGMAQGPIKVELATLWKMVAMGTDGMMSEGGVSEDALAGMVRAAANQFTFVEEGSTEGIKRFVIGNEEMTGNVSFYAESWLPKAMEITAKGEMGGMTMTTSDSKIVESFPEGTFAFTPDEGGTVMDLTPMLQMQLNQMGGGADEEDLEF